MRLFDSHCHLDFPELAGERVAVLERARAAGVSDVLVPGYEPAQWERLPALVAEAGAAGLRVRVAVGVHPYALAGDAAGWAARPVSELSELLALAATRLGAVAIGECGLDAPLAQRAGDACSPGAQDHVLRAHLEAARALELPLVLHVVRAHGAALDLLRASHVSAARARRGVVHAFSGSPELAREYTRLGFMLAFGGAITHPRHTRARAVARALPDDALLVETDAPSGRLAGGPAPNEPSALRAVVAALAELRGQTAEDVAAVTRANALALFGA